MNIISGIFNRIYMPVCRQYSRLFIKDKPADHLYRQLCSIQFRRTHGFWPNFIDPKRFNEKLWSRMLHDRSDWLTTVSSKDLVRDYVAECVGSHYLIPLLWRGTVAKRIPFDQLPKRYVIKATHGCGYNIIVNENSRISRARMIKQLSAWLNTNYCQDFAIGTEWGYRNIAPSILIEVYLGKENKVPEDYKFYCFSGRVEFLTQHFDRFNNHKTRSFDRNYLPHGFHYQFEQYRGDCPRPKNFDEMVEVAESLSKPFHFIRVDLYNVNDRIYFSELTPYPGGVSTKFLPDEMDIYLGKLWPMD